MRKIVFNILGSLLFFTCIFFGCKKDDSDSSPPQINFSNPADGQTFTAGDTARVIFSVVDNNAVSSISLVLVDANFTAVMPGINITPTGINASYSLVYSISDVHLNSGVYYFKIIASDGYNNVSKYRKINITALPRKRLGYYYVTHPTLNSVQVLKLDTNLVSLPYYLFYGDLSGSAISSYNQCLYTSGLYSGDANAITLPNPSLRWSVPAIIGPQPYFENIYNSGADTYISFYSGTVKGYDPNGNQRFMATVTNGYYPIHTLKQGGYIAAEAKDISSSARKLILFYTGTGVGAQECILSQDVVTFSTLDSNNILAFGNNGNQGVVQLYSISGNIFTTLVTLAAGKIYSALQVDNNTYLIAHSNGTIYKYIYSTSSVAPFINGVFAAHMAYDDINQELIVSQSNSIKKYNYATSGLINGITVADSVCGVHVLFNK